MVTATYALVGILALLAVLLVGLIIATIAMARRPPAGPTTTYNVVIPPVHPHLLHIAGPDASIVRVRRPKPRIIGEPDDDDDFRVLLSPPAERADPWDGSPPTRRPDPPEDSRITQERPSSESFVQAGPGRVAGDPPELVEAAKTLSLRQLRLQFGIGYQRARRLKEQYDPQWRSEP